VLLVLVIAGGAVFIAFLAGTGQSPPEMEMVIARTAPIPGAVPESPEAAAKGEGMGREPAAAGIKKEPVDRVGQRPVAAPVAKPAVKTAVKKPEPRPAQGATAKKTPSLKPWAVNVASFTSEPSARALKKRLDEAGYNSYVTMFVKDGVTWYRVRVGFYSTRDEAVKTGSTISGKFDKPGVWPVAPQEGEVARYSK